MAATRKKSPRKRASSRRKAPARKAPARKAPARKSSSRRYGKAASEQVEEALHELKRGELHSGKGGPVVKSRKQAIAIGLSQARKRGAKVPKQKSSS